MKSNLKLPKMIMFDQGGTLTHHLDWDPERGNRELWKYVVKNPYGCTEEDFLARSAEVFNGQIDEIKKAGFDFCSANLNRAVFDSLGVELSLSPVETETVFWDSSMRCESMEGIADLLSELEKMGIRTAVISNLCYSRAALEEHIKKYLPNNNFEFYIASSEYVFRKPSRFLFDAAIKKSGLSPDEIWYCGDNIEADVKGAYNAGMMPVWYDGDKKEAYFTETGEIPDLEFIRIRKWSELKDILGGLLQK